MTTQYPFVEKDHYKNNGVMDSTVLVEDGVVWDQGELQMSLSYENSENTLIENNNESYLTAVDEDGNNTQYFSLLETTNETILNGLSDMTLYTHSNNPEDVSDQEGSNTICDLEEHLDVFTIGESDDLFAYQAAYDEDGNIQRYRYMLRLNENGEYETVPESIELVAVDRDVEIPTDENIRLDIDKQDTYIKATPRNKNINVKTEECIQETHAGIENHSEDSYHNLQVNEGDEFYDEDETFEVDVERKPGIVDQNLLKIAKIETTNYSSEASTPTFIEEEDNDNIGSMETSMSESSTNVTLQPEELALTNFEQSYAIQNEITNDTGETADNELEEEQLIISDSCPLPDENEETSKSPISNYSEEHFDSGHTVELVDNLNEENESEGEEYQIVDGVHVTADNDGNEHEIMQGAGADAIIAKVSENQILKLQENVPILPTVIDTKIKSLFKKNGKLNKSLMYYVIKHPEKENVETHTENIVSNKVIKVNPRSVLKSSFKYLEQKTNKDKSQPETAKVEKKTIKTKEHPGRVFNNFLAKTTIIHAPVRQERLPRKQTIKPVERADEEIIVQEVVVSSNGFIETTEDGVLKSKTPLEPTDFVQVTDSDEDYNARTKQKKKKKKKKRRSKITKIVISDTEDDFSDDNIVQIDLCVESDEELSVIDNLSHERITKVSSVAQDLNPIATIKKKRGRPRKRPSVEESSTADSSSSAKKLKSSNDSESSDLITPKKLESTNVKIKWNCASCSKVFPSQGCLKTHMQYHTHHESNIKHNLFKKPVRTTPKPNNYKCTICHETFKNNYLLTKHVKEHNDPSNFECTICKKLFSDQIQLTNHKRSHLKEQMFNSTTLLKDSPKTKKLIKPKLSLSTIGREYKCIFCCKIFTSQMLLNSHSLSHKRFTCLSCAATFISKFALEDHVRHSCVKKLQSPSQRLSFKIRKSFYTPVRRDSGRHWTRKNVSTNKENANSSSSTDTDKKTNSANQMMLKCDNCSMVFKTHTNLFSHKVIKHGLETPDKNIKANKNKKLLHKESGKHSSVPIGEKLRNAFANLKTDK